MAVTEGCGDPSPRTLLGIRYLRELGVPSVYLESSAGSKAACSFPLRYAY